MDDFAACIVMIVILILALVGATTLILDVRHFKSIEKACVKRGYIQNDATRIYCNVEPLNERRHDK